jgi:hypothetical protein
LRDCSADIDGKNATRAFRCVVEPQRLSAPYALLLFDRISSTTHRRAMRPAASRLIERPQWHEVCFGNRLVQRLLGGSLL